MKAHWPIPAVGKRYNKFMASRATAHIATALKTEVIHDHQRIRRYQDHDGI